MVYRYFATTIAVQFTFSAGIETALTVLYRHSPERLNEFSADDLSIFCGASLLVAIMLWMPALFFVKLRALHVLGTERRSGSRHLFSSMCGIIDRSPIVRCLMRLEQPRLKAQNAFLTDRFSRHAPVSPCAHAHVHAHTLRSSVARVPAHLVERPVSRLMASCAPRVGWQYWQFMIWGRSGLLVAIGFIPTLITPDTENSDRIGASSPFAVRVVVWVHIGLAAAVIAGALAITARVRPYSYKFQNRRVPRPLPCHSPAPPLSSAAGSHASGILIARSLEMALQASVLAVLLLGGIYAFATDLQSKRRLVVEYVMLGSMILVLFLAMVYLAVVWYLAP